MGYLKKNVSKRICSFENLRKHSFFKGFNWEDLIDFHIVPPFFPFGDDISFDKYNIKYLKYLENDLRKSNIILNSIKSYDDDENLNFENNWDKEF